MSNKDSGKKIEKTKTDKKKELTEGDLDKASGGVNIGGWVSNNAPPIPSK